MVRTNTKYCYNSTVHQKIMVKSDTNFTTLTDIQTCMHTCTSKHTTLWHLACDIHIFSFSSGCCLIYECLTDVSEMRTVVHNRKPTTMHMGAAALAKLLLQLQSNLTTICSIIVNDIFANLVCLLSLVTIQGMRYKICTAKLLPNTFSTRQVILTQWTFCIFFYLSFVCNGCT